MWISVKDRLPSSEDAKRVLVYCSSGHIEVAYRWAMGRKEHVSWHGDNRCGTDSNLETTGYTITHWQPLPEPPGDRNKQPSDNK